MWIFCHLFCYTLPYFLLIFDVELALSFALFVCFLLLLLLFVFFVLFSFFSVFFFCKFNCSWRFFTLPGPVSPGGGAQRLHFEVGYRRVVNYAIDDLVKREA